MNVGKEIANGAIGKIINDIEYINNEIENNLVSSIYVGEDGKIHIV
jgi:hypothetical protein